MKRLAILVLALLAAGLLPAGCRRLPVKYDVAVLGGTPGAVAAAVAAARRGYRVCLIPEHLRVGGMMASGLGRTDIGSPELVGGISREVFHAIRDHYIETWGAESRQAEDCAGGLHFEPHVAEAVFERLLEEAGVIVYRGLRLVESHLSHNRLNSLELIDPESGKTREVHALVFVDATYTGDLYADAGASFRVGREPRVSFDESLAGYMFQKPYTTELLPGSTEHGDSLIQAYNYRLCLTDSLENQAPWPEPSNYDPERYADLLDYIRLKNPESERDFMIFGRLPNRKFDLNNWGYCWLSTDLIGGAHDYPQAEPEQRGRIEREHMDHILGLFKFLRTDPRVPENLRERFGRYAPAADEFTDNAHLPFQIYVREARRLNGRYTFTQHDALNDTLKADAIGMGSYPLDSHAVTGWDRAHPWAEGFFILECRPYQIPYSIMLPAWVRNLVVPVAVSASHVGYGSLRMEPVFMIMGEAAGVAASLCVKYNCQVDEAPVHELQEILRANGAVLSREEARPW